MEGHSMNTRLGGVSPTSPYKSWKFAGAVAAFLLLRNPVSLGTAQIEQEAPASQETRAVPMVADRWAGLQLRHPGRSERRALSFSCLALERRKSAQTD